MSEALLAPRTIARIDRLIALARRVASPRHRRPLLRRPGRGIEPGSRRDYAPGDDPRFVDWPAYARLERLLVKVQEELPEPRLDILLDGSASMGRGAPAPHERACLAAAALGACAAARGVRVGVGWAGPHPARLELHRPGELVRLLRFLAGLAPGGDGRLERTAARLVETARARGGAVIFSDGLDSGAIEAARRLRGRGWDPLVVLAAPAGELDEAARSAAFASGLAVLADAETGHRRAVPLDAEGLEAARMAREARIRAIAARLDEDGIASELLVHDAPFEAIALAFLRG